MASIEGKRLCHLRQASSDRKFSNPKMGVGYLIECDIKVEYRGLRPASRLVMTHKGQAFELSFKRRELESGPEVYRACDALQQTISRLYRQAGIKLGSSHSGRRSLAARVLAATGDVETVQTILGHQHLDHSKPYLTVDQDTLRRI